MTFKQMTVQKLINKLQKFNTNENIFMTARIRHGTSVTAINHVGWDKNGNLVITLDDTLLKKKMQKTSNTCSHEKTT